MITTVKNFVRNLRFEGGAPEKFLSILGLEVSLKFSVKIIFDKSTTYKTVGPFHLKIVGNVNCLPDGTYLYNDSVASIRESLFDNFL